jgi:hypothetical protein
MPTSGMPTISTLETIGLRNSQFWNCSMGSTLGSAWLRLPAGTGIVCDMGFFSFAECEVKVGERSEGPCAAPEKQPPSRELRGLTSFLKEEV